MHYWHYFSVNRVCLPKYKNSSAATALCTDSGLQSGHVPINSELYSWLQKCWKFDYVFSRTFLCAVSFISRVFSFTVRRAAMFVVVALLHTWKTANICYISMLTAPTIEHFVGQLWPTSAKSEHVHIVAVNQNCLFSLCCVSALLSFQQLNLVETSGTRRL